MKRLLKISVICTLMLLSMSMAKAQDPLMSPKADGVSIGNVKVSRDDKDLVVDYQIMLGDKVLSCSVEVTMLVGGPDGVRLPIDVRDLKGDFGTITESGFKQVRFNVESKKVYLAGKDIRFILNVKSKDVLDSKIVTVASMGVYPQLSYGAMLGYVKKFGGYVKFRSDFNSINSSYLCSRNGEVEGGGNMWASGKQAKARIHATGGFMLRATKWLYPYVGAGYGSRNVYWQDYEGEWAMVSDYSCKGLAVEAGAILKLGPVAISAGVSTTAFKYSELEIGVGIMF